jgi:DNA-binding NarL/FixJ family response regulator
MKNGSGGNGNGSRDGVTILVVRGKGDLLGSGGVPHNKKVFVTKAESERQAISEAARLHPDLVIAQGVPGEGLQPFVKNLREIVPQLPIFLVVDEYNHKTEKQALQCDITAVFSPKDDPSTILANALAVCE